jgi:hypothetical protein
MIRLQEIRDSVSMVNPARIVEKRGYPFQKDSMVYFYCKCREQIFGNMSTVSQNYLSLFTT